MARFAQRFVLERQIGAGGMARVFLGRDEILDRPVAVKILNPVHGGTDISDRFRREGRTAARLSHPNIVPVYDAGEGEFEGHEVSYIVMEYVPGGDLKGLIDERGPLPNGELAQLGAEVSSGLAHAHGKGVIHRDIKPQNILLTKTGEAEVADFGIARAQAATTMTQAGSVMGTVCYISPEQALGEPATPKSDLYSLGMVLYEMLTGGLPYDAETPGAIVMEHVGGLSRSPKVANPQVPDELDAVTVRLLSKDPDDRHADAPALVEDLGRVE
ncbi:MAG TPA: protein kinase, partial [Rubrobacter sp.]|nr:protein kinase [Rubrobacter sp.]